MYKVNGELFSCDITCSGRVPSRRGRHTQLCIVTSLKWIIQIFSNFYCWVSKIAFFFTQSPFLFGQTPPLKFIVIMLNVNEFIRKSISGVGHNILPFFVSTPESWGRGPIHTGFTFRLPLNPHLLHHTFLGMSCYRSRGDYFLS